MPFEVGKKRSNKGFHRLSQFSKSNFFLKLKRSNKVLLIHFKIGVHLRELLHYGTCTYLICERLFFLKKDKPSCH